MRWFLLVAGVVILAVGCTPLDLTSGLQTPDSLVVKTRGEPVAGRYALIDVQVLDKSGNPVSGVTVELYRKIKNSYGSYYVKEDEAKTDSFGWAELSFFSPKEGKYDLYVQVKGNPFIMESFSLDFTSPEWLFVVWMCGDNNLWGYGDQDLEEMENTNKSVSVVVFYDGGGTSDGILVLDDDGNWKAIMGITGVDFNSGSYEDLEYWLKYVFENFSSTYRALIMWDHGSAWIYDSIYASSKAISFDETSESAIAVRDLRVALENVINSVPGGQTLDILGFDACLMGSLEVIYELRNTAQYIVASSFNEPADGWDYSFLGKIAPDSTPLDVSKMIVDSYREYYSSYDTYQNGLSLAVYDTSQVEKFVHDLDSFTYDLKANLNEVNSIYSDVVKSYVVGYYNKKTVLVDLGDLIDKLRTKLSTVPDPSSFVVYSYGKKGDQELSAPVSIFMPENLAIYQTYEDDYMTLSFPSDTWWDEFLEYWLSQS
ncbi:MULTISPECIES: clostripain-related cysteine peptidase [unclassified Thermotoga]|uniref:clostripain-related cysteine peptidase n=1 Tax=unclassified Thermotoga TaxID=2631113 RepID=UPI000280E724|nr:MULTISPECIES: clostripain-related cysteine peptidase [unclassified Thermotoga]AIY85838.1 peptidase C11, clostripain [Thermotoga sp. 2812B]EJX26875.1 peptidase C11, clostripain [Thermotoga sp. EMP]